MGRRGRKRRLDVESEYWRLVLSGVGTVEACQRLGIGRKTGYRWRAENGGLPPAALGEGVRSQRYLSLLERQRIASLRRDGLGVRQIAEELGRAPSTISRELRRNTAAHDRGYDGDLAHARARERLLNLGWGDPDLMIQLASAESQLRSRQGRAEVCRTHRPAQSRAAYATAQCGEPERISWRVAAAMSSS